MCFIILIDLYTTHHNSLGICRQLKIHNFYGTYNISTQCICMGTESLLVYSFLSVWWKGAPSTNENRICGRVNCITYLLWYYNWFSCYELGVILEASRTTYLYSCYFLCVFYIYVSPAYSVISRYVLGFFMLSSVYVFFSFVVIYISK